MDKGKEEERHELFRVIRWREKTGVMYCEGLFYA